MVTKTYEQERIFVRGMGSKQYNAAEYRRWLKEHPRVIKGNTIPYEGGPRHWNRMLVTPESCPCQTIFTHIEFFGPGAAGLKHGHQNEAMFYILEGRGHEIHDNKRYDWEAGDVVIVHNGCVHQHFNDDPEKPARALIIKSKPVFLLFNLMQQSHVEAAPDIGREMAPPELHVFTGEVKGG